MTTNLEKYRDEARTFINAYLDRRTVGEFYGMKVRDYLNESGFTRFEVTVKNDKQLFSYDELNGEEVIETLAYHAAATVAR